MKRNIKLLMFTKVVLLLFGLVTSLQLMAYDFKIDGLCYNIISESNKTVELTWEAIGKGYEGDILVPNTVSYNATIYHVIGIGKCAFVKVKGLDNNGECNNWDSNNSLTKVILSSDISYIGDYSFDECKALLNVVFPSKLTSIGMQSFYACYNLSDIDLSATKTVSIGQMSFSYCRSLEKISLPRTLKTIGKYAFENSTNLNTIQIEISNPYLCLKDNVIFSNDMNSLIMCAPGKRGEYVIPEGVRTIEDTAFSGCEYLTKVILPQTLIHIGTDAFCYCRGLYEISLPEGLKEINYGAFRQCSYKSVTLPNSLTSVGPSAFSCETLEKIISNIINPYPIDEYVFGSNYNKTTLYVPQGTLSKYQQTEGWNLFKNIIEITSATYILSIKAIGSGSVYYDGETIRSKTSTFNVNEGTSATLSFSPDSGYRIKNVKKNNADVTSSVFNNQYTINNITANTTLEVEFEAIPPTTYTLSITASGNGSATYNSTTIKSKTQSFTVNEGTNATVTFTPDNGYLVASVKVNNNDVTYNVSNNAYTISNISQDTTLEVDFEAIPPTTYTLSITASGNGSATYNNSTIRNQTRSFTVNDGAYATIRFTPENGYRIASVRVNYTDVTSSVSNNQYTISSIYTDTSVEVVFEEIPVTTYTLSITASGNGSASYGGTNVRNKTQSFTLNEGSTVMITFNPDNGNSIASVKVNGSNVTSQISGNRYVINSMTRNMTVEVTFQEDVNALTIDGINYTVTSQSERTLTVTGGSFDQVLTVPATITANGTTWKVMGIDKDALKNNTELAAIIWNPEAAFTATVSNPNLLLYVKSAQYAPSTINNVVVNGTANSITLVDAASGNNFYCPQAFTAQSISYTHHYSMMTGIGESRGWETIALPFDVQEVAHASKGTIVPFAQWSSGNTAKPFWLYELKSNGFVEASGIKANTPYIISMPNNPQYTNQYLLVGNVTFSAENVTVSKSDNLQQSKYNDRTFVPNFQVQSSSLGYYALNVTNAYFTNNSGMTDGSRFVLNMRKILPFEAYMTTSSSNAPESIGIFDDMTTEIQKILNDMFNTSISVYDLQGRKIEKTKLAKGLYIVNGQKVIIK